MSVLPPLPQQFDSHKSPVHGAASPRRLPSTSSSGGNRHTPSRRGGGDGVDGLMDEYNVLMQSVNDEIDQTVQHETSVDITNIGDVEGDDDDSASNFSVDSIKASTPVRKDVPEHGSSSSASPARGRRSESGDRERVNRELTPSPEQKPTPARVRDSESKPRGDQFSPSKSLTALLHAFAEDDVSSSLLALAAEPDVEASFTPALHAASVSDAESNVKPDIKPGVVVKAAESSLLELGLSSSSNVEELKRANDCIMEALYQERKEKEKLQIKLSTSKVRLTLYIWLCTFYSILYNINHALSG